MNDQEQNKLNQELNQANKAKQLFQDPLLKESFDKLRNLYSQSLFNTGALEADAREKLWLAYNVINKVEQNLLEMIDTGKLASKQLEDFRNQIQEQKF
jgi:predicted O-linked N-acetylglucosamine transferase (SPINDLY family)